MPAKEVAYTAIFELNEQGGYTVTVPALPGLVTEGASLEEAKVMVQDAIVCYLEGLIKDQEPVPTERQVIKDTVRVAVAEA